MNVTVSVTTGTRVNVINSGSRSVGVASTDNDIIVSPTCNHSVSIATAITMAEINSIYYPRSNPSGYATGVSNATLVLRSETGQFYSSANPSGFITSTQTPGIQSINVSGNVISGAVTFTGVGGLAISITGQVIVISGSNNTGVSQSLNNVIFQTGDQAISGNKSFASPLVVTGSISAVNSTIFASNYGNNQGNTIIGAGSRVTLDSDANVTIDWQNLVLSGSWKAQGLNVSGQPVTTGGPYVSPSKFTDFVTGLPSGIDTLTVSFPSSLAGQPIINCEFQNDIDSFIYSHVISSVSISGFIVSFSDILSATGYKLHTRVTI